MNNNLQKRNPIVCVVGHVDHGKSSLLDYIRKTKVVDGEAGGITQHISAYEVGDITFLDTPGHAAFTSMRERGLEIADIAILIVSAEDGAKPQTKESFKQIEKKKIPFIVAINKIDKGTANLEMTKNSLADIGVYVEGWGGDVPFVGISAKTGVGIDELLELLNLQKDILNLEHDANSPAEGVVLESFMESKRGVAATLIIKNGKLNKGDFILAGASLAPTRIIENFQNKTIQADDCIAGKAIKIVGFDESPRTGESFLAYQNKKDAEKEQLEYTRLEKEMKEEELNMQEYDLSGDYILPIIIKTDVMGSLEAVENEISKIKIPGVKVKIIKKNVGPINEKDIMMAHIDLKTLVIAFNTDIEKKAIEMQRRYGIEINSFDVIYKMSEWLQEKVEESKPKEEVEVVAGELKVLRVFNRDKGEQIIGGEVKVGLIKNKGIIRIVRRDIQLGKGKIMELQSFKQIVDEVKEGNQCGLRVDSKYDVAEGDKLEYIVKETI
jgi:translation initiation factor IF-2